MLRQPGGRRLSKYMYHYHLLMLCVININSFAYALLYCLVMSHLVNLYILAGTPPPLAVGDEQLIALLDLCQCPDLHSEVSLCRARAKLAIRFRSNASVVVHEARRVTHFRGVDADGHLRIRRVRGVMGRQPEK